jgi:PAS domain S-box-containing protein
MVDWAAKLSRRSVILVWSGIFLVGATVGCLVGRGVGERLNAQLADQARRCAAAIGGDESRALGGSRADLGTPAYAVVKERLATLRAVNPNVRFLSLLRFVPSKGRVVFLAGSGPEGSGSLSPGDDNGGVARLPAFQRAIFTNMAAAEGPVDDSTGTWATGFATEPGESALSGAPAKDIVDLDISAGEWAGAEWAAGFPDAFYTWLVLGLPFGVTLVVRSQREQRKALRNLLGAIEQSQSAVMIVDLESCIEYVNASLCNQIGYSRRELLGRPWRDFQQPETPAELLAEMVASVRTGSSWNGEWFNRRRTGEVYPVRGAISPVKNRDGSLACFVAVFEDMTEAKRGEAKLRAALSQAEAGDRAKSQFLATMSHEVRTPLNGIIGFTSLLLDMTLTPEQHEYIQIIRTNGEALIQLTGDILDFAHIESGSLKLEAKPCSPRACVEETMDLLAVQASRKRVELTHWVDEGVPACIVADEARLRQVLVNLAGNAVKFTEEGEVEVTLRAEKGSASGVSADWLLTFAVRDTGIGIAAGDQDRLFKPFNQVDVSSTRRYGGTGLGLAISKNLVQLMGGSISVESGAGRGSVFSFTVPVAGAPAPARAVPDIRGMRLALVAKPGPFRAEFVRLAKRWQTPLVEANTPDGLVGGAWDVVFVEADSELAGLLAAPTDEADAPRPGEPAVLREVKPRVPWVPEKAYAIVPVSLPREHRSAIRAHFNQVINKPLHHDAIPELLGGAKPAPGAAERPERFELNVLVAEDNAINQRLVQKLLWNLGCTSTVTENGRAALEELSRGADTYDLVLMDLHMPEIDGLEAIQKVRAGEAGEPAQRLWIAALTADARAEQKERVLAAGGNDYIVKPIKLGELADALRRFLAARKRA